MVRMTSTLLILNGALLFVPAPTLCGYSTDVTGILQLCLVHRRLTMVLFLKVTMRPTMLAMLPVLVLVVQHVTIMLHVHRLKFYKRI